MRLLMFIVTLLACLISILMLATACKAQNPDSIKYLTLKTKITGSDGVTTRAFLHSVTDSGMSIMRTENRVYSSLDPGYLTQLKPENINAVSIRRKNQIGRGLGIGALTGAVIGVIVGAIGGSNEDSDGFRIGTGALALGGMVVGAGAGGILGICFSLDSWSYKINGQQSKYVRMQNDINRRLTKKKINK